MPASPLEAILSCLDEAGVTLTDVTHVTFYDKPFIKFERLLETYFSYAPRGSDRSWRRCPSG